MPGPFFYKRMMWRKRTDSRCGQECTNPGSKRERQKMSIANIVCSFRFSSAVSVTFLNVFLHELFQYIFL